MDLMIINGTGKRYAAQVDNHGRLYVKSNVVSHMSHHATYHKNAYIGLFETTLADANEVCVASIKNTDGTKDMEIYYIRVSSNADVEINVKVNDFRDSGGASIDMKNTNLSTAATLTAETYEGGASGDIVSDVTDSVEIDGAFLSANQSYKDDYEGAIVVSPNKSISFYAKGVAGDQIKVSISLALHNEGEKL